MAVKPSVTKQGQSAQLGDMRGKLYASAAFLSWIFPQAAGDGQDVQIRLNILIRKGR